VSGDAYVTEALEAVLADPSLVTEQNARPGLYRLLLALWDAVDVNLRASPPAEMAPRPEANLQTISPLARAAFLLTALEGFSTKEAAQALLVSEEKCERLLDEAGREIGDQVGGQILIIEDEPLISLDLVDIAQSAGHTVRHIARTHAEAIRAVRDDPPDLVLADIQLADGSSGLEAVQEILRSIDVPVVFITAYPERLLTGLMPEPTYLAAKPFRRETVRALMSQALFFHSPALRG
jgi:CheY-like chemotaxis protein